MSKPDVFIETAFLCTREKSADRVLESGKIASKDPAGGFLFYIIELSPQDNSNIVRKIVSILQNNVKTSAVLTPEVFESALSTINQTLGRLSEMSDNLWIGNLNAVVGLIDQDELLMSQTGNVTGYIFRQNKISSLTDQSDAEASPQPSRTFTDITSGTILSGDQLVFGNNELFNRISVDRLRSVAKSDDTVASAVELKRYLRKAGVRTVNAIFIEAVAELREQDHLEIVFLDEPEETVLKSVGKKMAPVLEKIKVSSREILLTSSKNGTKLAEKWLRSWREKYRPYSKKLIKQGHEKIRQGLSSSRQKIKELNYTKDNPSHLKIKAHSYHNTDKKKISFASIWDKIYPPIKSFFSRKNQRLIIIIILILIMIISYVKIKINNSNKETAVRSVQVAGAYDQASTLFTKAKQDMALGKTTSLDNFYQALDLAQTAKEDKTSLDKANALIKQINSVIDEKTQTVRFYDAKNYLLADGITKIILAGTEIYGVDSNNKIFMVDIRDRQSKLVGSLGQDSGEVSDLYYSENSNSILFDTANKKVLAFDLTKSVVSILANADSIGDWKGAQAIATYVSNIYTLDTDSDAVWKYTATGSSYSKVAAYANTKTVSLKDAIDLAIDGNVYVLKSDGSVAKFVKGAYESDFAIRNIPAPNNIIATPLKLFTDDTTNSIFVLDQKNSRVIKFDKSGEFNSQYVFDGVDLDSFVVDAKLQKIWGLANGKIYEGNL